MNLTSSGIVLVCSVPSWTAENLCPGVATSLLIAPWTLSPGCCSYRWAVTYSNLSQTWPSTPIIQLDLILTPSQVMLPVVSSLAEIKVHVTLYVHLIFMWFTPKLVNKQLALKPQERQDKVKWPYKEILLSFPFSVLHSLFYGAWLK